jgi:2Fe-2S ferredoxin
MNDTVSVIFVTAQGKRLTVEAQQGVSLMQAAIMNNVPGIEAECGGSCICATCHVYCNGTSDQLGAPADQENEMLETTAAERRPDSRLSCQIKVSGALEGAVITIPDRQY